LSRTAVTGQIVGVPVAAVGGLRRAHIFFLAKRAGFGFARACRVIRGGWALQGMTDLGLFGDERLQKRGPSFWGR